MGEGEHKFVAELPDAFQNVCGVFFHSVLSKQFAFYCDYIERDLKYFVNAVS